MTGSFIVIEGPDGTGKQTQSEKLLQRFQRLGRPSVMFDFPQYEETLSGRLVGKFLAGEFGGNREVNPYLASLPFAIDRFQAASKIRKELQYGNIVLANRYFLSNITHQAAKLPLDQRDEFCRFIEELEYGVFDIPREDLNIVLHVPPEISAELIERKKQRAYLGDGKKDIQEADFEYQKVVASMYRELPNKYSHVIGIDCTHNGQLMTEDEIHNLIWGKVESFLIGKEGRISRDREI